MYSHSHNSSTPVTMLIPVIILYGLCNFVQADWNNIHPKVKNFSLGQLFKYQPRITGGYEAEPNSLAYQVALIIPVADGHALCGGSLVSKRTVLTAAHCFENTTGTVEIILGAHYIRKYEPTQTRRTMVKSIVHSEYDPRLVLNDVALAIMDKEVQLRDCIQLVRLPPIPCQTYERMGRKALVSGWGRYTDHLRFISSALRQVYLPIVSNSICNLFYGGNIQSTQICVGDFSRRSTCGGDSGGPVMVDGVQIGIVSFGIALGCEVGWPSVLTRVSCFVDWIQNHKV